MSFASDDEALVPDVDAAADEGAAEQCCNATLCAWIESEVVAPGVGEPPLAALTSGTGKRHLVDGDGDGDAETRAGQGVAAR